MVGRRTKSRGPHEFQTCFFKNFGLIHGPSQNLSKCIIYTVCKYENFRQKPLKGKGRITEEKERGPPGYFVQGPHAKISVGN